MADNSLLFTILGIDKASPAFDRVSKAADRTAARLNRMGNVSAKTLAATAGAAIASGAAMGVALGGVPLLFGAIGAAAAATNTQTRDNMVSLGGEIHRGLIDAAAPAVPYIDRITSDIGASFGRLKPQINDAVRDSAPLMVQFVGGLTDFAENAMPGFNVAIRSSGPVLTGWRKLLGSSGTGVSEFYKEVSTGSRGTEVVLTGLGRMVETTLPRVGGLLVDLTDTAATYMPQAVRFVGNLAGAVGELGSGALPVLGFAVGGTLTVLNGLLVILSPITDDLGALVGVVVTLGLAWRTASAATGVITGMAGGLMTLSAAASATSPKISDASKKTGEWLARMGGPLGAVIGGAVVLLGLLGSSQESAAERTQRHATFARSLAGALRESSGAIDTNVRKTIAQDDSTKAAIESAKRFGIASDQVVDAVLGQGNALSELRTRLQEVIRANTTYVENAKTGIARPVQNEQAQAAAKLLGELDALNKKTGETATGQRDYARAIQSSGRSMLDSTSAGSRLSSAIKVLKDTAADADTKARALKDALDALTGGGLNLEESQAKVNSSLLQLQELFGKNVDRAQGYGKALLNADGSVNTMTRNGQALFSTLTGLRDATAETAQKTYQLALDQGQTMPQALEKARGVVQSSRDSFLAMATQMGLTRDQAAQLADRMHLIPDLVETLIRAPGLTPTQQELLILRARFDAVPNQKSITVTSLTREAQAELERIGFTVTRLPNGQVRVDAHTAAAKNELDSLTRPRTVTVGVRVVGNTGIQIRTPSGARMEAFGGVYTAAAYASGGLRPMRADRATIVPPNEGRLIGDRMWGDELFAPLDGSMRSWNYLAEGMRRQEIAAGGRNPLREGGTQAHYHLTVINAGNSEIDLRAQFTRMEQLADLRL
ncbi:hypothetical protein [Allokutzneria albata]|uniref:Uncharacterized protein n=1 Tax=Allokutzneria albata TaxID=211114 RepID=A0A1H0DUZ8_ALLAB|nr:hypothetical protein [Allokutzneria albata]SDN73955.1 hypothetical protein SAMN04489726_8008 [Allokutzneria albata]